MNLAETVSFKDGLIRSGAIAMTSVMLVMSAFSDTAVVYKFAPADSTLGTTPANAYSWDDPDIWPETPGYPSTSAAAVDMQNYGSTLKYVKVPSSGIAIGGLKSLGSKFYIIGDGTITIDSAGYPSSTVVSPGRIWGGLAIPDLIIYAPLVVKSDMNGKFSLACEW